MQHDIYEKQAESSCIYLVCSNSTRLPKVMIILLKSCKSPKIGNFSVVTLRVATLKIPDLVFFAIHPKFLIGTFVCYPLYLASFPLREWVVKNSSEQREKLAKTENFAMVE